MNNGSYINYPTTSKQIYPKTLGNSRTFPPPSTSIEQVSKIYEIKKLLEHSVIFIFCHV